MRPRAETQIESVDKRNQWHSLTHCCRVERAVHTFIWWCAKSGDESPKTKCTIYILTFFYKYNGLKIMCRLCLPDSDW